MDGIGGQNGGSIRAGTIAITPAILKLIAEIDEFKGAWTALGRISPERLTEKGRVEPAPDPFVPDRLLAICPEYV